MNFSPGRIVSCLDSTASLNLYFIYIYSLLCTTPTGQDERLCLGLCGYMWGLCESAVPERELLSHVYQGCVGRAVLQNESWRRQRWPQERKTGYVQCIQNKMLCFKLGKCRKIRNDPNTLNVYSKLEASLFLAQSDNRILGYLNFYFMKTVKITVYGNIALYVHKVDYTLRCLEYICSVCSPLIKTPLLLLYNVVLQ